MKRDLRLEREVERTISKYNHIKRLPSAFSKSSPTRVLDVTDIILILFCIVLFLFVFSRIILNKIDKIDKFTDILNDTDYLEYTYPYTISMLYQYKNNNHLMENIKLEESIES